MKIKMFATLVIIFGLLSGRSYGDVFNYEISARVNNIVSDFSFLVSQCLNVPYLAIIKNLVNLTDSDNSCHDLFFAEKLVYSNQIANLYVGLETGEFFDYYSDNNLPLGIGYGKSFPSSTNLAPVKFLYSVNEKGFRQTLIGNASYDVRNRPWYKTAKIERSHFWSEPYVDAASGNPVVSLVYPLVNISLKGINYTYAGAICADIYLTQISSFLSNAYQNTNRMIFIIDKATLSILASSFASETYAISPTTLKKVRVRTNIPSSFRFIYKHD